MRRMIWVGYVARGLYRVLVGIPETTCKTRRRWEDDIKIDLQDVGCGGMDWIDRLMIGRPTGGGLCKLGNEPSVSIKCGNFLTG